MTKLNYYNFSYFIFAYYSDTKYSSENGDI